MNQLDQVTETVLSLMFEQFAVEPRSSLVQIVIDRGYGSVSHGDFAMTVKDFVGCAEFKSGNYLLVVCFEILGGLIELTNYAIGTIDEDESAA